MTKIQKIRVAVSADDVQDKDDRALYARRLKELMSEVYPSTEVEVYLDEGRKLFVYRGNKISNKNYDVVDVMFELKRQVWREMGL